MHYLNSNSLQPGIASDTVNVEEGGCIGTSVCNPDPCAVNAVCEDVWNEHMCVCKEGWQGAPECAQSVDDCIGE